MLFSSTIFLFAFLPAVLAIYYILPKKIVVKNIFLLLASLFFYAWGEPKFVLVMILSIFCNYIFGILVDRYQHNPGKEKLCIVLMLVVNLGLLFLFKYTMFTLTTANSLFGADYNIPTIILPLGISFFTFHAISYVLDIHRGKVAVQKNPFYVGLYISFFPQLIAGPIVRYHDIADQIMDRKVTMNGFSEGVCRFILGLSKKVLIANNVAVVADKAFNMPSAELTLSMAWLGVIAYTLQIFFDFSGYSDMAIGLGKMFGFQFKENFNYPYISNSISDFWRRWHISLGSWFRDYLYIPLGGSRVSSNGRLVLNLLIVWGLTGLWHGANWTFILWGLLYFVFITLEKLTGFEKKSFGLIRQGLSHIYVLLIVMLGWVFFRSDTLATAVSYLATMFHFDGHIISNNMFILYLKEYWIYFAIGILISMPVAKKLSAKIQSLQPHLQKTFQVLIPVCYFLLLLLAVSFIAKDAYNPFIYFNF